MLSVSIRAAWWPRGAVPWLACGLVIIAGCLQAKDNRVGGPQRPAPAEQSRGQSTSFPLIPADEVMELGDLQPGSVLERRFTLRNASGEPIPIASIDTSCDCVTVKLMTTFMDPGEAAEAILRFDLRDEPEFSGGLLVDVAGWTLKGRDKVQVFAMQVSADVRQTKR